MGIINIQIITHFFIQTKTLFNKKQKVLTIPKDFELAIHEPAYPPPPTSKNDFLKKFDSEFTSIDPKLNDPEVRCLNQEEDQIFSTFNWMNEDAVKAYRK